MSLIQLFAGQLESQSCLLLSILYVCAEFSPLTSQAAINNSEFMLLSLTSKPMAWLERNSFL